MCSCPECPNNDVLSDAKEREIESRQLGLWEPEPLLDTRPQFTNDPQYFSE
jgi:hypothetical protein